MSVTHSGVGWTHRPLPDGTVMQGYSWNYLRGCSRVSPGCLHCYAEDLAGSKTMGQRPGQPYYDVVHMVGGDPRWNGTLAAIWDKIADPKRVKRGGMWFVNSMSDVFHEGILADTPHGADLRRAVAQAWEVMRDCPQHTFILVTKRPENIRALLPNDWGAGYPNVWISVTAENQDSADTRCRILATLPITVPGVSAEPLLTPIDFSEWIAPTPSARAQAHHRSTGHLVGRTADDHSWWCVICPIWWRTSDQPLLRWIKIGGESGTEPTIRRMEMTWAADIIEQCKAAGVAVYFKQTGTVTARDLHLRHRKGEDVTELPELFRIRQYPGDPIILPSPAPAREPGATQLSLLEE